MIPKTGTEFSFVRRNGSVTFEPGIVEPWAPLQNDPMGPAVADPARDKHIIAMLENLPLKPYRAVYKRNGTRAELQDIAHMIRLIKWLNEMEKWTKYSYHLSDKSFSIVHNG